VPSEPECGVVGCGMLAGCAAGVFSNLETVISEQVGYVGEINPNPEWMDRYEKMQRLFDDLYASGEQFWDRFEI
jgi:xylulokinase